MKIYNTLAGKKEDFVPNTPGQVNMYVCGPTVYNLLHVGNMRSYVVFDTARRYLEYKGYVVNMMQNFTDVDDKIINRSIEEGIDAKEITDRYIAEALADYESLNICHAHRYTRVTEEMDEIITMISQLIDAGYAYESGGHVFYDTRKFKGYGKLSKKNVDDLLAGARVQVNELKKSPVDFVLWKPNKEGEPYWDSPWGTGRPGWHIECSAVVRKYIEDVDIHGGGTDLIFPHHENEIAQSEALQDKPYAKYWMHNAMLTRGNKKMGKSLGNFSTLREVSEKFSFNVIRFFLLSGHYRMPLEYSDELLESAQKSLERIQTCWSMLKAVDDNDIGLDLADLREAEAFIKTFESRMDDDFNTADAISIIFEFVKFANIRVNGQEVSKAFADKLLELLELMCGLLGIEFEEQEESSPEIDKLVEQRQEARKNKDWALADKIRDELTAMGIVLEDTATGVRWTKK